MGSGPCRRSAHVCSLTHSTSDYVVYRWIGLWEVRAPNIFFAKRHWTLLNLNIIAFARSRGPTPFPPHAGVNGWRRWAVRRALPCAPLVLTPPCFSPWGSRAGYRVPYKVLAYLLSWAQYQYGDRCTGRSMKLYGAVFRTKIQNSKDPCVSSM